ncbi:MAG: hypothetical protein J5789_00890 [Oscillospiraceae bacterium]|nr:hypothetical protein [Oscillospiraceae bacterium]
MKDREFKIYWLTVLLIVFAVSFYPLYMGVRVLSDMIAQGTVMKENYPKYVIPYTPIAGAVILGVLLLPLFLRLFRRRALLGGSALSLGAFFGLELLFERKVVVTSSEAVAKLADWQMYLCRYIPPEEYAGETVIAVRTETAVDLLIGDYNPAFKLHFYMISVVLILAVLNCVYGFAQIVKTGNSARKKALIMQSIATGVFLGLCILACFTAFWRDGSILVSPLSASLMCVFFILLGVTVGIFLGSLLLGKRRALARLLPAVAASATTLLMYVGEMILLHGHLYRFGVGFFFDGLPAIVLAPADIAVILAAGLVTAILMRIVSGPRKEG